MHVIVNRVHPATGKAATLSNSKLKLSQWAEAYERGRGKILCPQRVENNATAEPRRIRAPSPDAATGVRASPGRQTDNEHLARTFAATMQRQQDAHLHEIGRAMKRSHARQWRGMTQALPGGAARRGGARRNPAEIRAGFLEHVRPGLRDTQARQRSEYAGGMGNPHRRAQGRFRPLRRPRGRCGGGRGPIGRD